MAVYTDISDDDLAHFLSRYDVGDLLSFKGIAEGVENTNYMVHTEKGQFILTLYEKRVKREDLPFFLDLMDHMSHAGILCPVTERDRQGQKLLELSGKPAALITFLEGLWVRRPQPHHCTALGKALGDFHLAGSHFGGARKNSMSVAEWHQLVKKIGRDADSICAGLADLIAEELDFLEQNWPSQQNTEKSAPLLPEGIIHADLFPDNVFFLDGKISGLIDFYFACNDILAYDLAICLNAWCFETDHAFNITKARALLGGYVGVRKISKEEFEALPLLARGAALRFLLTRIHDWLHPADGAFVQPKDPREYIRKLGFHQSIKSACEYGLALF